MFTLSLGLNTPAISAIRHSDVGCRWHVFRRLYDVKHCLNQLRAIDRFGHKLIASGVQALFAIRCHCVSCQGNDRARIHGIPQLARCGIAVQNGHLHIHQNGMIGSAACPCGQCCLNGHLSIFCDRDFSPPLSQYELNESLVTGPNQHHERLDGRGYPVGAATPEIHDWARICTVADVFEALTSNRPYRPALSIAHAFEIMDRDCGTAFDSEMLKCWKKTILSK